MNKYHDTSIIMSSNMYEFDGESLTETQALLGNTFDIHVTFTSINSNSM